MTQTTEVVRQLSDSTRAMGLLVRAVSEIPRSSNLFQTPHELLGTLATELAGQVRATSVVVAMGRGKAQIGVRYAGGTLRKSKAVDLPSEEVALASCLRIPLLAGNAVVGGICATIEKGDHEFRTPDRDFVRTMGRLLSLLIDRDDVLNALGILRERENALVRQTLQSYRYQKMLYEVSQLAQQASPGERLIYQRILQRVFYAVRVTATVLSIWPTVGEEDIFAAHGSEDAIHDLRTLVNKEASTACARGQYVVRTFRRVEKKDRSEGLFTVLIIPLGGLRSGQGVIAVARSRSLGCFTTVERQCCEIVAALIRTPWQDERSRRL